MSRTIFVSGATGTTGSATVRSLIAKSASVLAGVHSPDKSDAIEALGVAARPFDLADIPAMTAAMRGADGLFLVTPISEQTEVLSRAMVEAAKAAGVRHIVKLSGLDVEKKQGLRMARWHLAAEEAIRTSGLSWTFLRANAFMQNFHGAAHTIKAQGVYYNTYGAAEVSFVDAYDIGEVAATALLSDGHESRAYNLTGPRGVSNAEVVQLFSEAAGKSVTSIDVAGKQIAEAFVGFGIPEAVASATAELMDDMAGGSSGQVLPDIQTLLGRAPRDLAQWVDDNVAAFR